MCFKTYLNHPINKKRRKKKPKAITVLKKEGGGVRRGMIMITDSMVFFYPFPKSGSRDWRVPASGLVNILLCILMTLPLCSIASAGTLDLLRVANIL